MLARKSSNSTKMDIIRAATGMFLEKGYSATSPRAISDALNISTGNLTYYFQTKEHLLAVLVEMLCDFQWKVMQSAVQEGHTSLLAVCLELTAMAAMCEEDEKARDFYLSAYSHPLSLEIIRQNDRKRSQLVYSQFCPDWEEENFIEAEILVSGIEYATLMPAGDPVSLEMRIAGAINTILMTYNVPEEIRKEKISTVLAMDYRGTGKRILNEFKKYVEQANEKDMIS